MAWEPVLGYRLRFHVQQGNGDILLTLGSGPGQMHTTPLNGLPAPVFGALATLLSGDKDHRVVFDGVTLDAGPEKP